MKKISMLFIMIIISIGLFSCSTSRTNDVIVASSFPIYDLTKRVVGDKYEVETFTPAGVEPHEFEPTPSKVAKLHDAILYVENGLGFEKYELDEEIKNKTLTLSDGIDVIYSNHSHDDKIVKEVDPHIWLSLSNAIKMMENVYNRISLIDPSNEAYYKQNYLNNKVLFEALDSKYEETLKNAKSTYLTTTHEAFGYLCHEYGLTQISIMGISTEDKPTPQQLALIQEEIKDKGITTIFSEELQSEDFAKSVSETLNIKCGVLNTIEGLTDKTSSDDYLTLMAYNYLQIMEALC